MEFWQLCVAVLTLLFARLIMQTFVPPRLDPEYGPKQGYGLVPVDCFNSNTTESGIE
jgi:hypothetical protein